MTAGVFDALTNAFVHPITGGFGILSRYALPLLALLGLIYLLLRLAEVVVRGGALNDLLATVIWTLVKIGVFYWIIVVFRDLALAALNTFVTWGLAPSGGQFGLPELPAAVAHRRCRLHGRGATAGLDRQPNRHGRPVQHRPDPPVSCRLCGRHHRLRRHGPGGDGGA